MKGKLDKQRYLFRLKDMEFGSGKNFDLKIGTMVHIDDLCVSPNFISRIEIKKNKDEYSELGSCLYIRLLLGSLEVGSMFCETDYVVRVDKSNLGYTVRLRKAENYDYISENIIIV